MRTNNKFHRLQQGRIQSRAKNTESYEFFNVLTSSELLSQVDELLPEHRERGYPPTETLSMFLKQALTADRSCQRAVNESVIRRISEGLSPLSVATGAYCRARKRLPLAMIRSLVHTTGVLMEQQVPLSWCWKGKSVYLIDGTTMTMPDTVANQERYPQQGGQETGLGFPICRLLGVVSLSSGAIVNAAIGRFNGKGSDEQTLLRSVLDSFSVGDLVVGDAFYGGYFLLAALKEKSVDVVFEQMGARKRVVDFRKGRRVGNKDHVVELTKPAAKPQWMSEEYYAAAPDILRIRELYAGGKILITSMLSTQEASKDELKKLYQKRWTIEVDIRNLKTTMGMDVLSCKTPEMIEKEIWIYFLAYNLIRILMAQSALLNDVLPRQISFKHSVQLWLACDWNEMDETAMREVFMLVGQKEIGKRSGRIEPRALKRRPKAYPLLTKPRDLAREDVRKNGHPKKIK